MVYYKKKKTTYKRRPVYKKKGKTRYKKKAYSKTRLDDKISFKCHGDGFVTDWWQTPNITGAYNTDNEMTTYFPRADATGTTISHSPLSGSLANNQVNGIHPYFQYMRYKWIKVTFTPETWNALTLTTNATNGAQDGEKPVICIYSDDGSLALDTGLDDGVSIPIAQGKGNKAFKKYLFTKPISVYVKPYSLNSPDRTSPKYFSMTTWNPLPFTSPDINKYVPDLNLWYGFQNLPISTDGLSTPFRFKTDIEYCVAMKGMG